MLKQITYGTSTATDLAANQTTTISGTVDFLYKGASANNSNGVQWVTAYGTNEGGCTPPDGLSVTERCDDPHDKSGGLSDPLVMSKFGLQTVKTYVGNDSSTSHLDYSYAFSYQDTPFSTCTDPQSGMNAYCAGSHLLTGIRPQSTTPPTTTVMGPRWCFDSFFCVWNSGSCGGSPFKPMYDKMWTQQVVYQITSLENLLVHRVS